MNLLLEKYNHWVKNPYNGEILFFGGFILYIFWKVIRTTMFPYSEALFQICLILSVLMLASKIFLFDIYTFKMFIVVTGMMACGLLIAVSSGYLWPFIWLLTVVAAKDISYRKILQVYLLINIIIVGLAFCASLLGIIENLVYPTTDGTGLRYSFGCSYTTDFAAHIFFMLLISYYLYYKRLHWYHYAGTGMVAGFIYYFCKAKLDTICILLLMVFFGIYHIMRWQKGREQTVVPGMENGNMSLVIFKRTRICTKWKQFFGRLALVSMPFIGMVMYCLTSLYKQDNELIETINLTITGRLMLGKKGLEQFGVSLFGRDVPMEGMGGSLKHTKPYFFIDCSYLFILLRYGIIFLGIVFIIYGIICYKNKEDTALMLAILLLAISSSIDHHLLEEAYNPLGYALFASVGDMAFGKSFYLAAIKAQAKGMT